MNTGTRVLDNPPTYMHVCMQCDIVWCVH